MGDVDRTGGHLEQMGGKRLNVRGRHPRRAEIGIDVPGQYVLGLNGAQGLRILCRSGPLSGCQLGADVARQILVGRDPVLELRVVEDQRAQFGDHRVLGLAVEAGDERQIDRTLLVKRDEQPFLGAGDGGDGWGPAHHVFEQDRGFLRLARDLVVLFERHDQHGVRILAELHHVRHAADH